MGYARQKDDSCPGWDGMGQCDFMMLFATAQNIKLINCLFVEVSI